MNIHVDFDPYKIPEWFWDAIQRAENDPDKLDPILQEWDADRLYEFNNIFDNAAGILTLQPYVSHIKSECPLSDDSKDDVIHWVVSQGKEHYLQVLERPEMMPATKDTGDDLYGVASSVYYEKFDGEIDERDWYSSE